MLSKLVADHVLAELIGNFTHQCGSDGGFGFLVAEAEYSTRFAVGTKHDFVRSDFLHRMHAVDRPDKSLFLMSGQVIPDDQRLIAKLHEPAITAQQRVTAQ